MSDSVAQNNHTQDQSQGSNKEIENPKNTGKIELVNLQSKAIDNSKPLVAKKERKKTKMISLDNLTEIANFLKIIYPVEDLEKEVQVLVQILKNGNKTKKDLIGYLLLWSILAHEERIDLINENVKQVKNELEEEKDFMLFTSSEKITASTVKQFFSNFEIVENICQFILINDFQQLAICFLKSIEYDILSFSEDFLATFFQDNFDKNLNLLNKIMKYTHKQSEWDPRILNEEARKNNLILRLREFHASEVLEKTGAKFDSFVQLEEDLFIYCISKKMWSIAKTILRGRQHEFVNSRVIEAIIDAEGFSLVKMISRIRKKRFLTLLVREKLFKKFLELFQRPKSQERVISTLYSLRNWKFDLFIQRLIYKKFNDIFYSKNLENITFCINPLVLVVTIAYFLLKVSRNETFFSLKLTKLAIKYRSLAEVLMNSFEDMLTLKYILMKKNPISERPLIEILFYEKEFFSTILMNDTISKLVNDKWKSSYRYDTNIFIYSTSYNYVRGKYELGEKKGKNSKSNTSITSQDSESGPVSLSGISGVGTKAMSSEAVAGLRQAKGYRTVFSLIKSTRLKDTLGTNHITQFVVFSKSLPIRLVINFLFYLLLFIYIYFTFENFLSLVDDTEKLDEDSLNLLINVAFSGRNSFNGTNTSNSSDSLNTTNTSSDQTNTSSNQSTAATIESSNGPNPDVLKMLCRKEFILSVASLSNDDLNDYQTACQKFMLLILRYIDSQLTMKIVLTLCILLAVYRLTLFLYAWLLYRAIRFDYILIFDFGMLIITNTTLYLFLNMDDKYDSRDDLVGELTNFKFYLTILAFILWLKFLDFLRLTKTFGVLITILMIMIKDLMNFFVILLIVLLSFTSLFNILYRNDSAQYSSLYFSFQTLLSAALGAFTFDSSDNLSFSYGSTTLLSIYLFLTNVILLNLLIAILTNSYEKTIEKSNLEHSLVIYNEYKLQRPHKHFSALVQFPPPFNLISLVSLPLLVIFRSHKMNEFVLNIGFRLYSYILISIFIIGNIFILVPIAWIRILVMICIYHTRTTISSVRNLCTMMIKIVFDIFLWVIFGMIYLGVILQIKDIFQLLMQSYKKVDNKNKFPDTFNYTELKLLKKTIKYLLVYKVMKRVSISKFKKKFYKMVKIYFEGKKSNSHYIESKSRDKKSLKNYLSPLKKQKHVDEEHDKFNDAIMWKTLNTIDREFELFAQNLTSSDPENSKADFLDLERILNLLEGVRRMKKFTLSRSNSQKSFNLKSSSWIYIVDIPNVMKSITLFFKVEARRELEQEALDIDFQD